MNERPGGFRRKYHQAINRLRVTEGASWEDVTKFVAIRNRLGTLVAEVEAGLFPSNSEATDRPDSDAPAATDPPKEPHP